MSNTKALDTLAYLAGHFASLAEEGFGAERTDIDARTFYLGAAHGCRTATALMQGGFMLTPVVAEVPLPGNEVVRPRSRVRGATPGYALCPECGGEYKARGIAIHRRIKHGVTVD